MLKENILLSVNNCPLSGQAGPTSSCCLLSTSGGGADAVIHKATGSFYLFERGSRSEGWATGREDERGRKIQAGGQKLPSASLSLLLSPSLLPLFSLWQCASA